MPQEIRIKHLYAALNDIRGWTESVMKVLGSLDPEMLVPADTDRCEGVAIRIPPQPVPMVTAGVCYPKEWIVGPGESS